MHSAQRTVHNEIYSFDILNSHWQCFQCKLHQKKTGLYWTTVTLQWIFSLLLMKPTNLRRNENRKEIRMHFRNPELYKRVPCIHETMVKFYIYYCKLFIKRNQCSGNDIVIRYPPSAIRYPVQSHRNLFVRYYTCTP